MQQSVGKRTLVEACHPIQRKAAAAPSAEPASGTSSTGMPAPVQAKMEDAFGFDFSAVRIHQGPQADALGAQAFTQGTDVHFAPGKYAPEDPAGQALLGHELAHVVQQSQGRVAATTQAKGVDVNDDDGLEREADLAGAAAARGERMSMGGGGVSAECAPIQAKAAGSVVQMAPVDTHYGKFTDEKYDVEGSKLEAVIKFTPKDPIVAKKIGLTQSIKFQIGGVNQALDPASRERMSPTGDRIDRLSDRNTPIYGSDDLTGADKKLKDTKEDNNTSGNPTELNPFKDANNDGAPDNADNATYQLGHRIKQGTNWDVKDAGLHDSVYIRTSANTSREFETAALALEGAQENTYLGSVKWGWKRDNAGTLSKVPFALGSMGTPTKAFLGAAKGWNDAKTRGHVTPIANNTKVVDGSGTELFKINTGDKATQEDTITIADVGYISITMVGGAHDGEVGNVKTSELKDAGDGNDTVDLPVPKVKLTSAATALFKKDKGDDKTKDLPKDTRVTVTKTSNGRSQVQVADGPDTAKEGWIDSSKLNDE